MRRVLELVGEPWDDAVLDHARHIPDAGDTPPEPWLRGAARDRADPVAAWKSLTPRQVRLIEHLTRGSMEDGGYVPATFEAPPGRLAVLAEWMRQTPEALRFMWVGLVGRRRRR